MPRRYLQHCALAKALDVIGDRWVLLLIRELLIGPKRFRDLREALPTMGTNLLSARLKQLKQAGVIGTQPLPGGNHYALTERGQALEPLVLELVRWGMPLLASREKGSMSRLEWDTVAMRAVFDPKVAAGVSVAYQFEVGDEVIHAIVDDGALRTGPGPADGPDMTLATDRRTWTAITSGRLSLQDAVSAGRLRCDGSTSKLQHLAEIFATRAVWKK
ncbi:MAG: winged helix-turn-helix transcriptional regulator [Deltaproteobacteria bacterium]|nr:winged helix-turn-helix transcriptional regulator [Deltaproteobacteria bacterium]